MLGYFFSPLRLRRLISAARSSGVRSDQRDRASAPICSERSAFLMPFQRRRAMFAMYSRTVSSGIEAPDERRLLRGRGDQGETRDAVPAGELYNRGALGTDLVAASEHRELHAELAAAIARLLLVARDRKPLAGNEVDGPEVFPRGDLDALRVRHGLDSTYKLLVCQV